MCSGGWQVLRNLAARMHLPVAAIFEWLDSSLKARPSFAQPDFSITLVFPQLHVAAVLGAAASEPVEHKLSPCQSGDSKHLQG